MNFNQYIIPYLKAKFLNKPFYCHLYVTYNCNLSCRMCNIHNFRSKFRPLTKEKARVIAEKLAKISAKNIVLTGGEALLNKDIFSIIRILSKKGFNIRLQSNGLLIDRKMMKKLASCGLNQLTVSIDALNPEKEDFICQGKDVLNKAVKAIEYGVKYLKNGVVVGNAVVSRLNIEELPALAKFLSDKGAYASFIPVQVAETKNNQYPVKGNASDFLFRKTDLKTVEKIYNQLIKMKKRSVKILSSINYLKDSLKYINNDKSFKWKCDAGKLYLTIFPNGDVSACDDLKPMMNIFKENFLDNFKAGKLALLSKDQIESCPGCFWGCWRETSYLFENNINFLNTVIDSIKTKLKK